MTRFALSLLLLAVAAPTHASTIRWLHHSASPVTVPGGTSSFFLDDQPPPDLQPIVVETVTINDGTTVSLPTFTSVPFASDTPLEPFVSASVNLSADQEMTACVTFSQTVAQLSTSGVATTLGARMVSGLTLPMSPDVGLTGFTSIGLLGAITSGSTVHTGEGVALTVTLTNNCGADRTVYLSYDSPDANAYVRFVPTSEVEFKCQTTTSGLAGGFVYKKEKCLASCWGGVGKGIQPASDCVPPFGGKTALCISSLETKTIAKESACLDCPECYSGGDCAADATARVAGLESIVDGLSPALFCDDSGSGDGLSALEAKCQQRTATYLGKLANDVLKCLMNCHKREFKGRVPAGVCSSPVSDAKTVTCLTKVNAKVIVGIDRSCTDAPECYALDGAGWTAAVSPTVEGLDGGLFCGSPSGAFVD
jgi:hypothetical protein